MRITACVTQLARKVLARARTPRGFTMTEMATALTVTSVLTTMAAPSIEDYVSRARQVRAASDTRTIALSLLRLREDVSSQARKPKGLASFTVLVGPGDSPAVADGGDSRWVLPSGSSDVDLLMHHLVMNGPGYGPSPESATRRWRGPYLQNDVAADPWGHRYAVNVRWLSMRNGLDVIVLSAGPNGLIETPFEGDGLRPGGDDVVALVSSEG